MEQPEQASNPGQFDAWLYYKTRGIDYLFTADEVQLTEVRQGLSTWLAKCRQAAEKALYSMLPDREAGLTAAILLGSSGIAPETKELFQKIGIAHIFAISGLHIMLLYGWTLRGMSRLLGKRKGTAAGLVMLWLYTALTRRSSINSAGGHHDKHSGSRGPALQGGGSCNNGGPLSFYTVDKTAAIFAGCRFSAFLRLPFYPCAF